MPNLTFRERALVLGAVLTICGIALWSLVLGPALDKRQDSFAQLRKIDVIWAVLDQLPLDIMPPSQSSPLSLRERVTTSARAASIDIRRLDPQGTSVAVSLDAVPFVTLIGWIETLTTTLDVTVLAAEMGRAAQPGIVSARILVEDAQ